MIYLANYKGKRRKLSIKAVLNSFQDVLIRFLTRGKYSHCEIAIKRENGMYDCYSSSIRDGGVRHKVIKLRDDRWDLQEVYTISESDIVNYFNATKHHNYDVYGALGLVWYASHESEKSFCSEWCYNLLYNSSNGWRFSPNDLAIIVSEQIIKS